jgi:hypothetical protein
MPLVSERCQGITLRADLGQKLVSYYVFGFVEDGALLLLLSLLLCLVRLGSVEACLELSLLVHHQPQLGL